MIGYKEEVTIILNVLSAFNILVKTIHTEFESITGTRARNRIFKLENLKSRVTILDTIQIQLSLFKFAALFKIPATIQI